MPKSLCLGWSCETGPSCNITTVMIFQNSPSIVTLQHLVCQGYMVYSLWGKIHNYTTKLYFLSVRPSIHFHLVFIFVSSAFFNALFPLCLPDGAAMRAGVQTGDRIIKVLCSSTSLNCQLHCFLVQGQCRGCMLPPPGQLHYLLHSVVCEAGVRHQCGNLGLEWKDVGVCISLDSHHCIITVF